MRANLPIVTTTVTIMTLFHTVWLRDRATPFARSQPEAAVQLPIIPIAHRDITLHLKGSARGIDADFSQAGRLVGHSLSGTPFVD